LRDAALAPLAGERPAWEIEQPRAARWMLVSVVSKIVLHDLLRLEHDEARAVGEATVREMVRGPRARAAVPR